jgi:structural maintenance of chromosome 3 (chondroitin sulfate proteoglycan 6)
VLHLDVTVDAETSPSYSQLEAKKNAIEIELKERLLKRQEDIQARLDALGEGEDDSSADDLEARQRELRGLNSSIQSLTKKVQGMPTKRFPSQLKSTRLIADPSSPSSGMDKESENLTNKIQELRSTLEKVQAQQTEDSRSMSKQQKTTERYLAKRQMLSAKKDECNRNIRDLGVLPEEAFEKYINERVERVRCHSHVSLIAF